MSKSNKNRTVFIGNIAFDAQEEELRQLFQQVGPISNLRIVVDRETGKRKGFGFVEYSDPETALAAVRNLDNSEVKGRTLRVNIAEQDTKSSSDQASMMAGGRKRKGGSDGAPVGGGALPPPPPSTMDNILPPITGDPVAAYVERLGRAQMFELALQAKHFAATQPEEASRLMLTQPQVYSALQLVIDRLAGPHWPPPNNGSSSSNGAAVAAAVAKVEQMAAALPMAATPMMAAPPPQQPPAVPVAPVAPVAAAQRAAPVKKEQVDLADLERRRQEMFGALPSQPAQPLTPLEQAAAEMGVTPQVLEAQISGLTQEQLLALPPQQQAQVAMLKNMLAQQP